ncbi:DUF1365 domain-containing protein [Baekduia sp. Peel2402]|uniref:DUF1365 domain-containing protein n=1 Tax=Baekduia sp. Peel2402 TaxID=3458296 RepID=UPI00403E39AA
MSVVYEGTVRHRRFAVRPREFAHKISMVFEPSESAAVREAVGPEADGAIYVLTQRRVLGVGFNPVSFYFAYDLVGALRAVVAEVTSTPWGETARYVMSTDPDAPIQRVDVAKRMHVSPFQPMNQRYAWTTTQPGERLSVHIAAREGDRTVFDATLNLRRRPATRRALARHALLRLRVLPLIYGHAVVLALKRVPIHPHPQESHAP